MSFFRIILLAASAASASLFAGTPAFAALTYGLNDATLTDGTAVTGEFGMDVYNYPTSPLSIDVPGFGPWSNILFNVSPSISPDLKTLDILSTTYGYQVALQLTFADPLSGVTPEVDPIVLSSSFEACNYSCSGFGPTRYFASGYAQVPEPASLAILAAGVGGVSMARRRKRGA